MRENFLDYGRAFCIILVILTHLAMPNITYIGFLLMAFFFFSAGYVAKKSSLSFKEFTIKKFKQLVIPYYLMTMFYGIFEIGRAYYLGYGDYRIFLVSLMNMIYGSGELPRFGKYSEYINSLKFIRAYSVENITETILPTTSHLWFLPALFCASILFHIYINKLRKHRWNDLIALFLLALFASMESLSHPQLPYGLGRGLWGCGCMIVGYLTKELNLFRGNSKKKYFSFSIAIFLICLYLKSYQSSLVISHYGPYGVWSVLITLFGGTSGCIMLSYIFIVLDKFFKERDNIFLYIGRNTMPLYLWHMFFINVYGLLLLKLMNLEPMLNQYLDRFFPFTAYHLEKLFIAIISIASILIIKKYKDKHHNYNLCK